MSIANTNSQAVFRAFAALNAHDPAALAKVVHPRAAWYTPGRSPWAGEALGRDAVFALFTNYAQATGGTYRATLKELLQSPSGRVVAIHRDTAERHGKRLSAGCCTVFEFEEGLILEASDHFHDLYSWDQFWS